MSKLPAWSVGLITLLVLLVVCLWEYYPPIPRPLRLSVTFDSLAVGHGEPLVVTGQVAGGDFLGVRYVDDHTITLHYDSWGRGGPGSAPITVSTGKPYALEIELPALEAVSSNTSPRSDRLRVSFDGKVVLDDKVHFNERRAQHAWFGRNPLPGSSWDPEFRGRLTDSNGRPFKGAVRDVLTLSDRIAGWLQYTRGALAGSLLLSFVAAWGWHRIRDQPAVHVRRMATAGASLWTQHRAFTVVAGICAVTFAAMVTNGTFRLIFPEAFGNFYDYQAISLLQGRLDVPEGCLSGEAFMYGGKAYGYFGPTPALFRLPFMLFSFGFGQVSRLVMLFYYVATLAGSYLILRHVLQQLRPARPEPATWETVLFTLNVGFGTTAFFLASRAYIYHEAILCGIMFAVWSGWFSLRQLTAPGSKAWIAALLLGVLSIHARPPAGLFALVFLACCAVLPEIVAVRNRQLQRLRRPLAIAVLAGLGVLSFNGLSYAKFHTIDGCPLRLNVQYTAARLAKIDSKQLHLSNIPYGLDTYFFRPNVIVSRKFPWLYCGPILNPAEYPGAKLDLPDHTLAFPVGMTGLFLLATVGCAWLAWRVPGGWVPSAAAWAAFVPLTLSMCAAIATAERYTGDFVPFFICAGAIGLAAPIWRSWGAGLLAIATLWCCVLTLLVTLHYQGAMIWGVPEEVPKNYRELRQNVDRFFGVSPS